MPPRSILIVPIIVLTVLIGVFACSKKEPQADKPLILTTIYPYELVLKELVSPEIEVRSIIPANASPHTWSPNPSDMSDLDKAVLIISNGLGLEESIQKSLTAHQTKLISVEELLAIDAYENDTEHNDEAIHAEDEHHHEGPDPHIWTSMLNMGSLVKEISPKLIERFPQFADSINARSARLARDLQNLSTQLYNEAQALQGKGIITYHNSFNMLLLELGMETLAVVQSSPGTEPSAREMAELASIIKTNDVKAIFIEPQMSRHSADVLAKEFQLKVLALDPIGHSLGISRITEYYMANWNSIKSAFND